MGGCESASITTATTTVVLCICHRFDYFHEAITHEELARVGCPGFYSGCGDGMVIGKLAPCSKVARVAYVLRDAHTASCESPPALVSACRLPPIKQFASEEMKRKLLPEVRAGPRWTLASQCARCLL